MRENILKKRIQKKQTRYNDAKSVLEKRLGQATSEYQSMLTDFRNQINYIQSDSYLTKEGKREKCLEIKRKFIEKTRNAAKEHYDYLNSQISIIEKENEVDRLENCIGLTAESLPQMIYVNSMLSSVNSINDADLISQLLEYVSLEGNFSDELVNMLHVKAKSILNNKESNKSAEVNPWDKSNEPAARVQAKRSIESSVNADLTSKIRGVVDTINNYKNDNSEDLNSYKMTFTRGLNTGNYPGNLFMNKDINKDFATPYDQNLDPWAK